MGFDAASCTGNSICSQIGGLCSTLIGLLPPQADIDRNGMVDGTDLPFIAPLFGQECTP